MSDTKQATEGRAADGQAAGLELDESPAAQAAGAGAAAAPAAQAAGAGAAAAGADAGAPAAPVEADEAAEIEEDLDELVKIAAQRDEYLALAQRTQADFENYRKRVARESAAAQERGVARLARELLPALDNLDRALEEAGAAVGGDGEARRHPLAEGVKLVRAELAAALARVGIESFDPVGEPFDPTHHEAMAQQPVEGAESGTVVEVYQAGYRLNGTVIRPARVVVAA